MIVPSSSLKVSKTDPDQQDYQSNEACAWLRNTDGGVIHQRYICRVLCKVPHIPRHMSSLSQLSHLVSKSCQDVGAAPGRTEDHFKASTLRNDKGTGLVVIRIAVCIWTDPFRLGGILTGRARSWCTVFTSATKFRLIPPGARTEARVENGALDIVIGIGIDSITWFLRRCELQRPGAPLLDEALGDGLLEGNGVGRICPKGNVHRISNVGQE